MNHQKRGITFGFLTIFIILCLAAGSFAAPKNILNRRFVWYRGTFWRSHEPARVLKVIRDAAPLGYNGIMISDLLSTIKLEEQKPIYAQNIKQIVATAKQLNMIVVPQNLHQLDVSRQDSTMVEALPVCSTKFVVTNGEARAVGDAPISISNGGFESSSGNMPTGWKGRDTFNPGVSVFIDRTVKHSGSASLRIQNPKGRIRVETGVKLKPYRAYELSLWIKTEGYAGALRVGFEVMSGPRQVLNRRDRTFMTAHPYRYSTLGPTQNWSLQKIDFNSLDLTSASVRLVAAPHASAGKIWFDDIKIREVGLYENIRRPSLPVVVKSEDGSKIYKEKTDYVVDSKFSAYYEGKLIIPKGSAINNGQSLRVDWYQFGDVETYLAPTNLCDEKAWDILRDDTKRMNEVFERPQAWTMWWDEWRVGFWDPACVKQHKSPGHYKGAVSKRGENLLRCFNKNMEIYVYGGVYDPYHQGKKSYRMNNGSSEYAWEGLGDSTIVSSWNGGGIHQALKFFGGKDPKYPTQKRQFRQMVTVWGNAGSANAWLKGIEAAEQLGISNIIGMQYMTWGPGTDGIAGDYRWLAAVANVFKNAGRWGTGPVNLPEPVADPKCDISIATAPAPLPTPGIAGMNGRMLHTRLTNRGLKLSYELQTNSHIRVSVVNMLGQAIDILADHKQEAGKHTVVWNSSGLQAGVYFVRATIQDALGHRSNVTKKVILM